MGFLLETKYYNQLVDDLHGMFSLSVSSLLYLKVVQRLFSLFQIIKSKLLQSVFPIFHGLATLNFFFLLSIFLLLCL